MFNVATEVQELLYEWSWEGFYVACSWIMGKITKEVEFEFHETHHKKRYFIIKKDLRVVLIFFASIIGITLYGR